MSSQKYIRHHLDLSTGHVTKHDMELLEDDADNRDGYLPPSDYKVACTRYRYGVIVFICGDPSDQDDLRDRISKFQAAGYSEAFCNLYTMAYEVDADMIRLDRDGEIFDELPTFEW